MSAFLLDLLRTPGWGAGSKWLKAHGDPGPVLQGFRSQLGLCRPLLVGPVHVLRPTKPRPCPTVASSLSEPTE